MRTGTWGLIIVVIITGLAGLWLFTDLGAVNWASNSQNTSSANIQQKSLRIGYAFAPGSLNPFKINTEIREKLVDTYQSLTKFDQNLSIKPNLALSWGRIKPLTWKIILRDQVKFHSGKQMNADDVIYSINYAKNQDKSDLYDYLTSVKSLTKINDLEIEIELLQNDPLFLAKLTRVPIVPNLKDNWLVADGTGPYKIADSSNLNKIQLTRYEQYWSTLPDFEKVELLSILNKNERIEDLISKKLDFLVNVPPDSVYKLQKSDLKLSFVPSLEVSFLIFNLKDPLFADIRWRKAIVETLDKSVFLDLLLGFATVQNQFVSTGVFGFNPQIKSPAVDKNVLKNLVEKELDTFANPVIAFYYPDNIPLLGQFVKEQLESSGLEIQLEPRKPDQYLKLLETNSMPFFYLGWRSEFGDSLAILESVFHTRENNKLDNKLGSFNASALSDQKIDQLIKDAGNEVNEQKRLKIQQEIMKILVNEEYIGIPLFESQLIFAYQKYLETEIPVEGIIYPSAINMVK